MIVNDELDWTGKEDIAAQYEVLPMGLPKELTKHRGASIRMIGLPSWIRTRHFSDTIDQPDP
jgi:hypothetical protein